MSPVLIVALVLIVAIGFGLWDRKRSGKIKEIVNSQHLIVSKDIGSELGEEATILQFSSAFCTPCRATRSTLTSVISHYPKIKHIEVDAESNLELVRRLDIRQTPTTLFLNPAGREIARAVGAPKRDQVFDALERI
ncbi:MAG: thioredoxin family protein [Actinomycetota bacterium]